MAAFLLSKGADRDVKTKDGRGMFDIACATGNTPLVREFVTAGKADNALSTMLAHAAAQVRLEIVRLLVEKGADVNDPPSPILRAVAGDSVPQAIPDPNPRSEDDRSEIVELLIKNGAKVDVAPHAGLTWMHAAAPFRGARVIKALLKAGVQPDLPAGSNYRTPLHIAAVTGRVETVRLLLDAGADPKKVDRQGNGLLLIAATGGHAELVRFLIEEHFPVNVKNSVHGGTPFHCAALATSPECVRTLLAAGALVNALDVGGGTPLYQAIDSRPRWIHSDPIKPPSANGGQKWQTTYKTGRESSTYS